MFRINKLTLTLLNQILQINFMYNQFSNPVNTPAEGARLTPHELIKKHILDPNHTVTDEELNELQVGVPPVLNYSDSDILIFRRNSHKLSAI